MSAVGPGAVIRSTENPKATLWGATDDDVVQIFNPLPVDFIGIVGVDKAVNVPFQIRKTQGAEAATADENSARMNYGINLKNADHNSVAHITTQVLLPAGVTTSLLGGVAKVIVGQLVSEIMQRNKDSLRLADPTARLEVEADVIKGLSSVQNYLPGFQTERSQINAAVDNLNKGTADENPILNENGQPDASGTGSPTVETGNSDRPGPGRPKKVQDTPS